MNNRLKSWTALSWWSQWVNHMLKTIIKFTYEWEGRNTWEQTFTHDRSDWNTCTKSTRLQGLINNYYTLRTSEGWSCCGVSVTVKSDEKLLKVKSYEKCKIAYVYYSITLWLYQSHNRVRQSSDTVQAQQIPMVTKRLSLTETSVQNLLTARVKSLLHTSKQ